MHLEILKLNSGILIIFFALGTVLEGRVRQVLQFLIVSTFKIRPFVAFIVYYIRNKVNQEKCKKKFFQREIERSAFTGTVI